MQPHVYKTTKRGKARISVSPEKSGSNAHLTGKILKQQLEDAISVSRDEKQKRGQTWSA